MHNQRTTPISHNERLKNSSDQPKFGYCYGEFEFGDVPCVYSK
jgi:hypothetical protein